MARFARVLVPGLPYHVTHRGNRKSPVFFSSRDRRVYLAWLREYSSRYGMKVWAYCLMNNHVHLIVVGERRDSLANAIGRTHMRFARWINHCRGWTGHLWGNRFFSTVLDDQHLWSATKYVELNPVRAHLVRQATDYAWSSARAHALGQDDSLLSSSRPFPGAIGSWAEWLEEGLDDETIEVVRKATSTGRPCGSRLFIEQLEGSLGRRLTPRRRGRKPRRL